MTEANLKTSRFQTSIWKPAGFAAFALGCAVLCLQEPSPTNVSMMFSFLREPPGRYLVILAGIGALCLSMYGLTFVWRGLRGIPLVEVTDTDLVVRGFLTRRLPRHTVNAVVEDAGMIALRTASGRTVRIPVNFCRDAQAARTALRRLYRQNRDAH